MSVRTKQGLEAITGSDCETYQSPVITSTSTSRAIRAIACAASPVAPLTLPILKGLLSGIFSRHDGETKG